MGAQEQSRHALRERILKCTSFSACLAHNERLVIRTTSLINAFCCPVLRRDVSQAQRLLRILQIQM